MLRRVLALLACGLACETDFNCSYNGDCVDGACACAPGWEGAFCHRLALLPVVNGSGLDLTRGGGGAPAISTWGGSVVRDDAGAYHMFASLVTRHCGIHRWLTNSVVARATSASATGPFALARGADGDVAPSAIVFGLFAHEPLATRAPDGTYALYFTAWPNGSAADAPPCNCSDGDSSSGEDGCFDEPGVGANKTLLSYVSSAPAPEGPWSAPQPLARAQEGLEQTDMNLAPVIREDGSALAWTRWSIWTSPRWDDAAAFEDRGEAPDWDNVSFWEGEDPYVWRDARGRWHMLSHDGARGEGGTDAEPAGDCGRHWFSTSGAAGTWNAVPNASLALGGCAYPRANVSFADGPRRTFYRRERPHLVFGDDGVTPVALTTSVIDSPVYGVDRSYTLLQAIGRGESSSDSPIALAQ